MTTPGYFSSFSTVAGPPPKIDWDEVRAAMAEMDAIREKGVRNLATLVEELTCSKCGRKPTITNNGSGDTIVVCRHTWDVLQTLPKCVDSHPVSPISGLRVAVFDDGPFRW